MIRNHVTLSSIPIGRQFRIRRLRSQEDVSSRLREMGFFENAVGRCIMKGDGNVICEVHSARIGLNAALADSILVSAHE